MSRPELILGPLLRYVSEGEATIWVETSEACEVEVLGRVEPTFRVDDHHYALVRLEGLPADRTIEYEVALDGERCWPPPDSGMPASVIRTLGGDGALDIYFGSCRIALPHEPPYTSIKDEDERGREVDAIRILAWETAGRERDQWPDQLFLLGDQVYVDEGSPRARERIRERRGTADGPEAEVTDFEEYTWLYHESWREPLVRWLFSTVPVAMLWDDHDMSDDWNISRAWLDEVRAHPWWHHRAVGGLMSYWIYQHLGNLSPRELDANDLYREIRANQHAGGPLRRWAEGISSERAGIRWSYCRDIGRTRVVFVDSRAGRCLEEGERRMVDDEEWEWIVERTAGEFDHLLIATTVPFLLTESFHHLEAWNEAVCAGAWGPVARRPAEKLRRALDFDHWASFQESFGRMGALLREVASRDDAPASVVVLSGDVHHAYLAEVDLGDRGAKAPVYQAVCSPLRNPLDHRERAVIRLGFRRGAAAVARALSRLAGAPQPEFGWRIVEGPCFDNQVAAITIDGRESTMRLRKTQRDGERERPLELSFERRLV